MHICFISSMHPPLDKRVHYKEAVSLVKNGFQISHISPSLERIKTDENINFILYDPPLSLINRIIQIPKLFFLASKTDADCFHCNEVDSIIVGIFLRFFKKKICIFDVHEHYPSEFVERKRLGLFSPIIKYFLWLFIWVLALLSNRVVLAKKSLFREFKYLPRSKLILVENYASKDFINRTKEKEYITHGNFLKIIHLGLINNSRGLDILLESIPLCKTENIELLIIGEMSDRSENEFRSDLIHKGLDQKVDYINWLPLDQALEKLVDYDLGLVLFQDGRLNHKYALPHKLFDYIGCGLAVVVPDFSEIVNQIVIDHECGISIDVSKPQNLARAFDHLACNRKLLEQYGRAGRSLVLDTMNWENEERKLLLMYTEIRKIILSKYS